MRIMLDQKKDDAISPVEETEGGRSPSGVSSTGSAPAWRPPPDPEVPEKPVRRKFTAEYKLKILAEADRCTEYGQIGGLLRREGLYSSHLSEWRRKRMEGTLVSLSPKKRGPKPEKNPLAPEVARLERENERLQRKLKQAETIIDVQKKVSGLLGIDLASPEPGEES
ncbi:MAG TPA: transposase [Candidatus Anoxymicrobiaceae bacterium]|jgi:transposase-like protein